MLCPVNQEFTSFSISNEYTIFYFFKQQTQQKKSRRITSRAKTSVKDSTKKVKEQAYPSSGNSKFDYSTLSFKAAKTNLKIHSEFFCSNPMNLNKEPRIFVRSNKLALPSLHNTSVDHE